MMTSAVATIIQATSPLLGTGADAAGAAAAVAVAADALAILVGQVLGKRLPARAIKLAAAGIFLLFGVWTLVAAFHER